MGVVLLLLFCMFACMHALPPYRSIDRPTDRLTAWLH